jgi:hypothetical protein
VGTGRAALRILYPHPQTSFSKNRFFKSFYYLDFNALVLEGTGQIQFGSAQWYLPATQSIAFSQ